MFTICPDCGNDKLKVKNMSRMIYDPATTRTTVDAEVPMQEFHCSQCGWTVLLEDPAGGVPQMETDRQDQRAGRLSGARQDR